MILCLHNHQEIDIEFFMDLRLYHVILILINRNIDHVYPRQSLRGHLLKAY